MGFHFRFGQNIILHYNLFTEKKIRTQNALKYLHVDLYLCDFRQFNSRKQIRKSLLSDAISFLLLAKLCLFTSNLSVENILKILVF